MNELNLKRKLNRQIRCVRVYAKALHLDIDAAYHRWIDTDCAERWANDYEINYGQI